MKKLPPELINSIKNQKLEEVVMSLGGQKNQLIFVEFQFETDIIGVTLDCTDENHSLKMTHRKRDWKTK